MTYSLKVPGYIPHTHTTTSHSTQNKPNELREKALPQDIYLRGVLREADIAGRKEDNKGTQLHNPTKNENFQII